MKIAMYKISMYSGCVALRLELEKATLKNRYVIQVQGLGWWLK